MIGDLPEADAKPPENMLFVCKLNQVCMQLLPPLHVNATGTAKLHEFHNGRMPIASSRRRPAGTFLTAMTLHSSTNVGLQVSSAYEPLPCTQRVADGPHPSQVTTEEDLEIIFSRFGTITSCDIIRDHKTGVHLQHHLDRSGVPGHD